MEIVNKKEAKAFITKDTSEIWQLKNGTKYATYLDITIGDRNNDGSMIFISKSQKFSSYLPL